MTGRERVARTIRRQKTDRMPIYGWLNNEGFQPKVVEGYGSVDAFCDKYEFDMYHLFPGCHAVANGQRHYPSTYFEDGLPDLEFTDPETMPYDRAEEAVELYSGKK
ncbi:MAG: hypothetical protein FWE70_07125, partial [Oscillospiraceae bacterium]|nr:hypothetical protein [Oscillospiraceae bacterium]